MATPNRSKMMNLLQHRLRVTLNDTRQITGQLLAFDVHMNLVLSDATEYRSLRSKEKASTTSTTTAGAGATAAQNEKREEKRSLGLIILRGEWIVSVTVEGPPPTDPRDRLAKGSAGPGVGRAVGRGQSLGSASAGVLGAGVVPGMSALGGPIARNPGGGFAPPPSTAGRGGYGR